LSCGQKFVDLSDGSLCISLLKDCKYGYAASNGVIDVDLIETPKKGRAPK
jgi:alpha-mannosidase